MQTQRNKKDIFLFKVIAAGASILLLAALLIPMDSKPLLRIRRAKGEIANLVAAMEQYHRAYGIESIPFGHWYASTNDFTFGTFETSAAKFGITNRSDRQANNSEIMAALLDIEKFGNGKDSPNKNHALNPQRTVLLNVRMSGDTKSPGVGLDGVYRDPWGNPYIISIDFNGDGRTRDAFYSLASISEIAADQAEGLNSLARPTPPLYHSATASNSFEAKVRVMVWSLGPDGKADATKKANEGANKDNILSW